MRDHQCGLGKVPHSCGTLAMDLVVDILEEGSYFLFLWNPLMIFVQMVHFHQFLLEHFFVECFRSELEYIPSKQPAR